MASESSPRPRILTEATRLFGQHGYNATSVREVVEAAGVTKPTLYYYFASKEALFREAVRTQIDGLSVMIDGVLQADVDARSRCSLFLTTFVGGGLQHPDSVRLMMMANTHIERGQPHIALVPMFWDQVGRLGVLFERDAEIRVAMLVGVANELLFRGLEGVELPTDYAKRAVQILYAGEDEAS